MSSLIDFLMYCLATVFAAYLLIGLGIGLTWPLWMWGRYD